MGPSGVQDFFLLRGKTALHSELSHGFPTAEHSLPVAALLTADAAEIEQPQAEGESFGVQAVELPLRLLGVIGVQKGLYV